MTEYEAYQEHIRYTHDTYCRIVIRHASFDAARMLAARWKREISLEYLTEEKFVPLSTSDEYFQVPDYGETYPFSVRGQTILLDSYSLAAALAGLSEQTQEEICARVIFRDDLVQSLLAEVTPDEQDAKRV